MDNKPDSNESRLAELRKKHGALVECVTPKDPRNPDVSNVQLAFRSPNQEEYEDWQEGMKKDRMGPTFRSLCLRTRVLPESEELLIKVFEHWPGLAARIQDKVTDLGGADIQVTVKKD